MCLTVSVSSCGYSSRYPDELDWHFFAFCNSLIAAGLFTENAFILGDMMRTVCVCVCLQVRGLGSGAAATCNWITNAAVSQTFLTLIQQLGGSGTFWLYAAIALAGAVWVYFALPETNGECFCRHCPCDGLLTNLCMHSLMHLILAR